MNVILAGNAQTHPTASLIVGVLAVVVTLAVLAWFFTR
jgi:Mg2+ and Co2+ transporter CorA